MKLYCSLFLLTCLLVGGDGQAMQACSPGKSDCSCKDITYSTCHTPPASQELHVGSLEECIQNCDLFGSFGQCNYLLFWSSGPDENCKLIADTTLDQYVAACGVVGQPLRDADGSCMASAASGSCSLVNCGNECHMCDSNDLCGLYTKTECEKLGSPGETSDNIPNFQTCLSLCTSQQQSNPFTYVTYDQESQECICYPDGLNQCTITAVPYGMTLDQADQCNGCLSDGDCPPERPICSVLTGRCVECEKNDDCSTGNICSSDHVCIPDDCGGCAAPTPVCDTVSGECYECVVDSDCPAEKPDCDLGEHVCKPECMHDGDCGDSDYCMCHTDIIKDDCPGGGACVTGCRDVGSACTVTNGGTGVCNGHHVCIQYGEATLTTIKIGTKDCSGCSSLRAGSGASITMTTQPPLGAVTCTTGILDKPGITDYTPGVEAAFTDDTSLSSCFQFGLSSKVTEFKVTWTGTGTWTPEKFALERRFGEDWPFCCYNPNGVTLSEGQDQTFTCEETGAEC